MYGYFFRRNINVCALVMPNRKMYISIPDKMMQ